MDTINKIVEYIPMSLKNKIPYFIPTQLPTWCSVLFMTTILVCILIYVFMMYGKKKCPKNVPQSGILGLHHASDTKTDNYLCNYIIKASYSSCAVGNFKNDYVDLCALKSVIKQGCRFLDFEIYSLDGDPVVAVSKSASFNEKGSFNSLDLRNVLKCVYDNAISTYDNSTISCPNPKDPLILNFRMKTSMIDIYNKMAYQLSSIFATVLLSNEYNLNNVASSEGAYDDNMWTSLKLNDAVGKVIVMVDSVDSLLESSRLYEMVNVMSNGTYTNMIRNNDVNYTMQNGKTPSNEYYTSANYTKTTVVLPPLQHRPVNYPANQCFNLGIQICCMCFQSENENLSAYNKAFSEEQSAFILKNKFNDDVKLYRATALPEIPPAENVIVSTVTDMGRFIPSVLTDLN
jgi:hypothetical protein